MKSSSPFWDKGLSTILAVPRDKPGFDVGGIGLRLANFSRMERTFGKQKMK